MTPPGAPQALRIAINGSWLDDTAAGLVAEVRVRSRLAMPTQCAVTIDLSSRRSGQRFPTPTPGDRLRATLVDADEPLFEGEVTALGYDYTADRGEVLRIRAYDALHRLRQQQTMRVLEQVSLVDVARRLCDGLDLSVDGPEGPRWERLYVTAGSDLEFLRDLAGSCGCYPVVEGGRLRLLPLHGDGDPVDLELGKAIHSVTLDVNTEPGFSAVRALRWDAASAEDGSGSAASSDAGAEVGISADPSSTGGGGDRLLVDVASRDDIVATARATAVLDRMTAERVTATLVADGDPVLRAGRRIRILGVAPEVCGTYAVTDALHVLDADGYTVTISTRPPAPPSPTQDGTVVTLGTVIGVNDPDGLARVRLRLDAIGALETGWAPVVLPAAGAGKGALLLPDVDDRVAVLLPHGDPDQVLVLGGLFGRSAPAENSIAGDRVRRFALSATNGQRLLLDGEAKTLVLEGHNGSKLEFADELASLSSSTDLVVEAPGRKITIKAASVAFEEA